MAELFLKIAIKNIQSMHAVLIDAILVELDVESAVVLFVAYCYFYT